MVVRGRLRDTEGLYGPQGVGGLSLGSVCQRETDPTRRRPSGRKADGSRKVSGKECGLEAGQCARLLLAPERARLRQLG